MIQSYNQTGLATGDAGADEFLRQNATAVLMGILFDQRIRAEVAFAGPFKLNARLGHLKMDRIAEMDEAEFFDAFTLSPSIHRFANVMAARTQQFAQKMHLEYKGDANNIWNTAHDLATVNNRVQEFSGFGPGKLKKLVPAMSLFDHQLPAG